MTVTEPRSREDRRLEEYEKANAFIEDVLALREKDRGKFASLKRNAGNTIAESRGIYWFYRLLNRHATDRDYEIYFLVATLVGFNPKINASGDFGNSVKQLSLPGKANPEAVERRFQILLNSDFSRIDGQVAGGELAFRLRQMVKQLASKDVKINWAQLLVDLKSWGLAQKYVQKRWAASFYGQPEAELAIPDATSE